MILELILTLWLGSCFICFILALRTWQVAKRKFLNEFTDQERKDFYFLQRQDFNLRRRDIAELFVGSLLLFPIRSIAAILNTASIMIIMVLFSGRCTLEITVNTYNQFSDGRDMQPRALRDRAKQAKARSWLRKVVAYHCRTLLFLCGITKVREFRVLNANFDFPFEESKSRIMVEPCDPNLDPETELPCCVVSNHVAMLDIVFYIMRLFPSFIAKSVIVNQPIVGPCARALNCVFVNRSNVVDREKTIKIIGQRQEEIWKASLSDHVSENMSGKLKTFLNYSSSVNNYKPINTGIKELPPMVIFGEGTTTSGRTIMPLKRGAFLGLRPVRPCVLVYRCPQVHIAYDIFPLCWLAPLVMSCLRGTTLDVYWLSEVLPPTPCFGDAENRSMMFAESVRNRMARVLESQLDDPHRNTQKKYPEEWAGSMASKRECLSKLFSSSKGSKSIVATTKYAVSLS